MGAECCFEIFNEFRLLCCLNFMGQECAGIVRESSRCWQHFYAVFTSTETIFFPLPLRFQTQSELQQGSDWLNCNQKHFLMLYAITINCIYINDKVASIFLCNLGSDSELERHFGPAFSGPKFFTGSLICTSSKFCLVHLVTLSAMPPLDNYITMYISIEKPWQALDITMVGVYHVQMWKWIAMIFLCDIFSGARGMLKSLCNHRQLQLPNGKKWQIVGGRCWEKIVIHGH